MSQADLKTRTDFTEGSVVGSILKMGLPSMFGFLAQHVYAMADMFWVSHLSQGESAVAAITFFNNLLWLLFSFNSLVGPGSVAVISRRYGEKEFDETERAIKETITLKLFFGAILGLVGYFILPWMLDILGAEGEAHAMGVSYGRILLVGLPIMYATYSIFTALRGIANPAMAMAMMIGSNILNLALDPLFIFGYAGLPEFGIEGAAIASVASYTITLGIGLYLFGTDHTNVRLHLVSKLSMSIKSMWKIVRIGIPTFLGDLSFSGSRLMLTPIVASFGTATVAAYGVGMQIFAFGIMMLVGMGLGLSSLIGHNIGSNKLERAKETADKSILIGIGSMAVLGVLTFAIARIYSGLFFDSPETIQITVDFLRIMALTFPFFGAFIMLEQIHGGVGLNTPYMVISIIHSWGFQVVPAVIVTQFFGLGATAVWWVLAISGVASSTIFYLYYRTGRWLYYKV